MTKTEFLARFPEFSPTDETAPGLLEAVLAETLAELDADLFGSDLNQAHGYLTAYRLVASPRGRTLKVSASAVSRYREQFNEILQLKTALLRIGGFGA